MRALLIQKDAKLLFVVACFTQCLRALLIQKDAKLLVVDYLYRQGLRALLIQKDAKPFCKQENSSFV